MEHQDLPEHPYLILTLRRTGGTSLTTFLSEVSSFATKEHEPFNPDRVWGGITEEFKRTKNVDLLRSKLGEALQSRPNIKHCIEVVPGVLTQELITACHERQYRLMLLTRRDETSRLISLFLAQSTGAWGPDEARQIYRNIMAGQTKPNPIQLHEVKQRYLLDAGILGQTLSVLRYKEIPYKWLVFEELYKGQTPIETQAIEIAKYLGLRIEAEDPNLATFSNQPGQNSKVIEPYVPGIAEARDILSREVVA
ncbi:hypothetical protein [Thalassococcus sp. S3]|uniref:hypothetical protein n=1 Tax=Thalassococcus sp. S3 TaxID=2017482 RepID=UPI00102478DC|nr:hypothetical protein [Thalassococcus sp. S3]QBF34245.1 hypothetical protein CFI11_23965 [Thalassococcus sp. S3]